MTVHSPVCVPTLNSNNTLFPWLCMDSYFVQWLVASFLTWHSLHGKPAPAYSFAGQQPRASLLSCHSSLSISERVQNCKYFFCFFSSTIFFFFILVFSHVYIFDYWSIHFLLYIEETRFISLLFPPFIQYMMCLNWTPFNILIILIIFSSQILDITLCEWYYYFDL